MDKLTVHGLSMEVLKRYREITGIRTQLKKRLLAEPPAVFIGVDAPDFNLDLERQLKKRGIPAIHYVSPSIWAWRGKRIDKIAKSVSHMLCLFPFEPALYQAKNIPVTYVGHPLADIIPPQVDRIAARDKLELDRDAPIFAVLPGSRESELNFLAETYIDTIKLVHERLPNARFLVPLATRETRNIFEIVLYQREAQHLPIRLMFGHAADAMAAADTVLVASGTATLEAALLQRPMVIAYRMAPSSWKLMKRMKYQPWVGLPNILAGRFVVPEFLQEEATPENLAQALLNLNNDKPTRYAIELEFARQHRLLRNDTAEKAARAILAVLNRTAPDA
jgi:lipid-A-disaccharide synthase